MIGFAVLGDLDREAPDTPGYFGIVRDSGIVAQSHGVVQEGHVQTMPAPRSTSPASAKSEQRSPTSIVSDSAAHRGAFSSHARANSWTALSPMSADSEQRSLMNPHHRRKHHAHDGGRVLRSARASVASEDSIARSSGAHAFLLELLCFPDFLTSLQ